MTAIELSACKKTKLIAKPVFIEGVMQGAMRELLAPCDVIVNGVALRLPTGTVIALHGGGSGGAVGSLLTDLEFTARSGETYRATKGMQLRIPT